MKKLVLFLLASGVIVKILHDAERRSNAGLLSAGAKQEVTDMHRWEDEGGNVMPPQSVP